MANLEIDRLDRAIEVVKMAVEYDEGTLEGKDDFMEEFNAEDYPANQVHLILNQSQGIIREVLLNNPNGRLAEVIKRSLELITNPDGSHCYTRQTALSIYGLESLNIDF